MPFKEGFVGTIGSSNRQALNIRTFAALGIEASLVQQNSSTSQFESPTGNDIPVDLVLIQGGTTFTIPGSVSWKVKDGGALQIFGFTPDSSQPTYQDITLTIPGGGTYSLVGSSNYGVVKTSTTLANLGIVDGQSSVSGSNDPVNLADLNDYLDDVRASRPFGPITTDSQTVYATLNGGSYTSQPTITGEACIVTASTTSAGTERIDVVVDGTGYTNVSYTVQGDGQVGSTTCDTDATDGLTIEAVTWSLDLSAQSPAQSVTPGTYDITASVVTTAPIYNVLTDSTSGELEVVYETPELTVTKTATLDKTVAGGATSVDVGDVIDYQISIENTGNVAMATPSSLTDTITASGASNLTLTYASGDTGSDNIIGVGETWVYTASYTLDSGDLLTGQVDNIAEVSATSSFGTPITVQSSATGNTTSTGSVTTTTFSSLSSLFISKTASLDTEVVGGANDTSVDVGDQITYTVTVSNTGNTVLTNVVVSDTLSRVAADNTATTVASTSTTPALLGTATDNDGTTSGSTMNPNEQWVYTYTYTLTQDDIDAGRMSNLASVTDGSLYVESTTAGNTDTSVLPSAAPSGSPTVTSLTQSPEMLVKKVTDLTVTGATYLTGNNADIVDQDASGTVSVGDRVYFTITVKNTGNVTLSSVSLADTLTTNEAAPTTLSMTSGPTLTADTGTTGDAILAVGDLWTYSGYYTLTQNDIDLGVGIKNLATFTSTPPSGTGISTGSTAGGNTSGAGSAIVVSLEGTAAITGIKTVAITNDTGATGLSLGDTLTYTIIATNSGDVTLTGVGISAETLSRGTTSLTAISGFGATDFTTSDSTTLAPGASATFTATYVVTQDDIDAGGLSNTATVEGTAPDASTVDDVTDDGDTGAGDTGADPTVSVVAGTAAITGIKTVAISNDIGATGLSLGDTLTYTITATNSGDVTLTGVGISAETLSRGTTSLTAISGFGASDFSTSDSTTLAPGASATFTATYVVTQDDIDAGGLSNTATVEGTAPGGSTVDDVTDDGDTGSGDTGADPTVSTVAGTAAITGIKTVAITNDTGATGLSLGDTLTYTITATNSGDVTLTGVGISAETLSRGTTSLTAISGFGTSDFATSDSTTLAPGASATFTATYVVTQDDIDAGGLSNTATVEGTALGGSTVDDVTDDGDTGAGDTGADPTVSTVSGTAAITGIKTVAITTDTGATGLSLGDTLTYTITATNSGDVTLTGVGISAETLSRGTTSLTAISGFGARDFTTSDSTTLAPGASATFTATYVVTQGDIDAGGLSNTATVEGTAPDTSTVDDVTDDGDTGAGDTGADPTVSTITSAPAIAIQKTVDDSALDDGVRAGDVLHYTITIENIGDVTLQNIAITDNLSDMGGTALSLDAAPAKTSDTGANTADAILEIGDVWTYTADYTLTASDIAAGGVENIAIVSAETPSGSTVTAESKTSGNTSNDGDGAPTETGFPGEISGTVIEYQAGVQGVIVYLLEETSSGVYDYVDDPQNPGTRLSTTTDANGNYAFVGLPPMTYGIEFSNPNSDAVPTASSATHSESGNRILGITVGAGAVEVEQDAFLIDPSGVVYDSSTFAPLSGATVTLYYQSSAGASARIVPDSWLDTDHGDANGVVTGSDGKYAYFLKSDRARDGIYTLEVEKADYLFTSSVIVPQSGSYNAGLGGRVVPVTADATPHAAMDTTYYLAFEMVFTGSAATSSNGVVHNNIPLDAIPSLLLEIEDDLVQILKDDLSATMTQQGQEMAGFAAGALDRLKQRDSNSCASDVAKELADNPIRFATASAVILPESEETLNRIAALLATCPEAAFEVAGHTDDQADADYNQRLSQSRAANIVAALTARGIAAERLSAAGYGESRPVADNATEEGRLLNRRVEFVAVDLLATEEPCRNTQTLVRDLNIQGDDAGLTAEGSFNSEVRDCAIDGWRIFSGATSYLTDDGISQGMFKLNYRVERFVTNDRVSGWFAGIYGSDDTISGSAAGSIKGFGVNGGLYGAARLDANLFADYYLGAAAGRHSFDLDFERAQGTINAEGSYDYYALFAGAALSGEFDVNDYVLAPRFGVDAAWSPGGEAWVTASRAGFEESGALSTGEVSGLRFFGELRVADLLLDDPAVLSITPRFFCERAIGSDDNTCGMGAKLSYESRNEVTGDHVGFELDIDGAKGRQYYSVGVNVGQPMFGGDVETNVGVGANSSVDLGLTYTAAF
ncbi:DUF7507 domain-containing protein [Marivivens aquimaris]|uniref:DUF7507 domain-containing protein n=1 Tax=Marivivens aquimaris TaxID=2774876 RepID=UPI001881C39B|nr:OmpA family protein [Marivivens aquimaris]